MPLPADWTTVTIRWSGVLLSGAPATGFIKAMPSITRFKDPGELGADASAILATEIKVPIVNGAATFTLPATDDTSVSPQPFTYLITEQVTGTPDKTYSISVPVASAGTGIDLVLVSS